MIPEGWYEGTLGDVVELVRGVSYKPQQLKFQVDQDSVILLRSNNIQDCGITLTDIQIVPKSIVKKTQILNSGDIALCMSNGSKKLVGKSAVYQHSTVTPLTVGAFCSIAKPRTPLARYYFQSRFFFDEVSVLLSGSAINNLKNTDIDRIKILLPPLPEQKKIAEILSSVDDAIQATKKVIDQTDKVKAGLLQELMTRGIGHTKFKMTEIGEIPEEWEVLTLEEVARCFVGIASSATHAYRESGVLLLRNQNIKEGNIDLREVLFVDKEYERQHKSKRLREGDILTIRTGYPGVSAVVPKALEGCQSFTTLVTRIFDNKISSNFLCFYINSDFGKSFFLGSQAGGAQKNVGTTSLKKLKVLVPPMEEQNIIVSVLEIIDHVKNKNHGKLSILMSLKKGLMQDLLTGKVRVKVS